MINRNLLFLILVLVSCGSLAAQNDPLGPHNVNGSGCVLCHVPDRPATQGAEAEAEGEFWGRTSTTPDTAAEPGMFAKEQPLFHTFICFTCHDGSIASAGKIGRDVTAAKQRKITFQPVIARSGDEHPVHVPYLPNDGCGEPSASCNPDHWPSRVDRRGVLLWSGSNLTEGAATVYGRPARFFPSPENGGQAMVECSTCHNPHSFQTVSYKVQGKVEVKPSQAFVRGWYETDGKYSDSASRFCQSCHYGEAADSFNLKQ